MALGFLRTAMIAGGKAADIIRVTEEKRQKDMTDAMNKFVDNTAPQLKAASAKQKLISSRVKRDLSTIVNNFFKESNLPDNIKYELASSIYSTNGNKLQNVLNDAKARRLQYAYANKGNTDGFSYLNSYVDEGSLKDVSSDRSLDQIAQSYALELAPMPTLDLEAKAKALGAYKETAFVKPDTSKIYDNLVASTGYMEQKPVPEGPAIGIKPAPVDLSKIQAFETGELRKTQIEQDISTFDNKKKLLEAKVKNIPLNRELLEDKVELSQVDVDQIDINKRLKNLQEKRAKIALEKETEQAKELKRKIAIGDFTFDNLMKRYKFLRDDGYAEIATGFNQTTGSFILPSNKPALLQKVKQNAFQSIMQDIKEQNVDGLLNSDIVSKFMALANTIPAISASANVTPEFGKIYINPTTKQKYIYLGANVLQDNSTPPRDITNIPIFGQ